QRARNMPHCSAERERESARQTLDRLIASAPRVTLSYGRTVEDRQVGASPLLAGMACNTSTSIARPFAPAGVECLTDEAGPPTDVTPQSGGASLLKSMAECPFKAFAGYRLNARELEDSEFGVSASERGIGLHGAMQVLWN